MRPYRLLAEALAEVEEGVDFYVSPRSTANARRSEPRTGFTRAWIVPTRLLAFCADSEALARVWPEPTDEG